MASSLQALFFFFLLVSTVAGREIPTDAKTQVFDGTVWVPGLGRFMLPRKGTRSLDYNPITGAPGGHGISITGITGPLGSHRYIPGGDDTALPNPIGGLIP